MKPYILYFVFILLTLFSKSSFAHRINIVAFVDGDTIQVESTFSNNQKVNNGKIIFSDLETKKILLEGRTDEQGLFRFRPDNHFLKTGHPLNILLDAGEGHQASKQMTTQDLDALSTINQSSELVKQSPVPVKKTAPSQHSQQYSSVSIPDTDMLESVIERIMDKKLGPIKQALARQESNTPTIRDIIGGMGWIIGLFGIAAYFKSKQR